MSNGAFHQIAEMVVPYILTLVVGVQVWMIRKIIECMNWRSKSCFMHNQHEIDDKNLRGAIERLEAKIDRGFDRVDKKLDAIDRRCIAHMARGVSPPEE